MPSLRPLRFVGPCLLLVSVAVVLALSPTASLLAGAQVALVTVGGALFTIAAFGNPLRARLGWRPLLGLGEVAVGVAVPIGVLGAGVDTALGNLYAVVAAVAAVALVAVIGSQMLLARA